MRRRFTWDALRAPSMRWMYQEASAGQTLDSARHAGQTIAMPGSITEPEAPEIAGPKRASVINRITAKGLRSARVARPRRAVGASIECATQSARHYQGLLDCIEAGRHDCVVVERIIGEMRDVDGMCLVESGLVGADGAASHSVRATDPDHIQDVIYELLDATFRLDRVHAQARSTAPRHRRFARVGSRRGQHHAL